ncbi:MAG: hypothetical protein JW811_09555 [Clostridiales bacterium]|nr:hypothetical protein [Clostridiales bacterium]
MLQIDKTVHGLYPDAKMGILAIGNVDASAPPDSDATAEAVNEIRRRYGHLDRAGLKALPSVKPYVDYYKKFGYSYHVLAQLESILSGKRSLSAPSGLLAAMFQTELESMLLTAGHDLAALQLPLKLKLASGNEQFQSISGTTVATVKGDLMVCSGNDVISSILRGPNFGSRITKSTAGVLFTVYAPQGVDNATIKTMMQTLEERIRTCSPAANTLELHIFES